MDNLTACSQYRMLQHAWSLVLVFLNHLTTATATTLACTPFKILGLVHQSLAQVAPKYLGGCCRMYAGAQFGRVPITSIC